MLFNNSLSLHVLNRLMDRYIDRHTFFRGRQDFSCEWNERKEKVLNGTGLIPELIKKNKNFNMGFKP